MKKKKTDTEYVHPWEWQFAYVAGYTSGGAPYGIRHDELDENGELIYKCMSEDELDDFELGDDELKDDRIVTDLKKDEIADNPLDELPF